MILWTYHNIEVSDTILKQLLYFNIYIYIYRQETYLIVLLNILYFHESFEIIFKATLINYKATNVTVHMTYIPLMVYNL